MRLLSRGSYSLTFAIGIALLPLSSGIADDPIGARCRSLATAQDLVEAFAWCFVADSRNEPGARTKLNDLANRLSIGDQARGMRRASAIEQQLSTASRSNGPAVAPGDMAGADTPRTRDPEEIDSRCGKEYDCIPFLSSNPSYFGAADAVYAERLGTALKTTDAGKLCDQRFPGNHLARKLCRDEQVEHAKDAGKGLRDLERYGSKGEKQRFADCMRDRKRNSDVDFTDMQDIKECAGSAQ